MNATPLSRCTAILAVFAALFSLAAPLSAADEPTDAARKAAGEIRREALLAPRGPEGRPLPLATHWNVGTVKGSFEPDHQIGLLQAGHRVLPWISWPGRKPGDERFDAYWGRLLRYCAALDLPVSFRGTQWNAMLVKKEYRNGPADRWAGVVKPDGTRVPKLSPFGPAAPWKDPAAAYVDTPAMKRCRELYPDPPLVLWVSNNEPPDLRWKKHGGLEKNSKRYLQKYGQGKSDAFKRRVVGEGWIERYRVMFRAMREALENPAWRKNVRFVGYGAFGPAHFGRWSGWKVYSLICEKWVSPDLHCWAGGSPSYYTHNWNGNRDHRVFSTQVQSMNWLFMLDEALSVNPEFWFEISTWDGNEVGAWMEGLGVDDPAKLAAASSRPLDPAARKNLDKKLLKKSKALQYMAEGQTYPPERTLGWVQFGLWLLRPRAVREFRGHATQLVPVRPYWLQTVTAVDRVWDNPVLREYWRRGELVPNRAHRHPYRTLIPEQYRDVHRWYLLDTSLDPPRPWKQNTDLPVFSLAIAREEDGKRSCLLYAHAPRAAREDVAITVPGCGEVTVDVPRAGAFWTVAAGTGRAEKVAVE